MAYDKEKREITISGDQKQFEKDLFAHFAHITEEVNAELAKKPPPKKPKTLSEKPRSLRRSTKISIVFFLAWTVYVFYRTANYHELLGFELDRWDREYFFSNWLVVPGVILALSKGMAWALGSKQSDK